MRTPFSVDIAVPCNKWQSPVWWTEVFSEALRCASSGIKINAILSHQGAMTDAARNGNMRHFLGGKSDWVWQIDDDTVPPKGALLRLLELETPFASGVYYMKGDVHAHTGQYPLVYKDDKETVVGVHAYKTLGSGEDEQYYQNEIIQADAIGFGCSLLHRQVLYDYMDHYALLQRPTGPLYPAEPHLVDQYLSTGMRQIDRLRWNNPMVYPFFVMDNGRTEDFFFCERVRELGYKPLVDTRIQCGHLAEYAVGVEDFLR